MIVKNAILELDITGIDYMGYGISHYDNHTIFVDNALVGERVKAQINKVNDRLAFGKTLEIINKSLDRIKPECLYSTSCGGCNFLHVTYESELKIKEEILKNTISKMVKGLNYKPIIAMDSPYNYRNKISLPVGFDDEFITGFYHERSHRIIPSKECLIEQTYARNIVNKIVDYLNKSKLQPYNEETNSGDIRHLVLRGNHFGEFMVTLVFREYSKKIIEFVKSIQIDRVVSLFININPNKTNVILGDSYYHISGIDYLREELFDNNYKIHPNSFFQVNYYGMEKLYKKAIEYLNPSKDDTIIDAYCGIGSIALSVAKHVNKVYGIEVIKEAIDNAKENASNNKIDNAEFLLGKCEDLISDLVSNKKIDGIIVDPPRKGCETKFLDAIIANKIPKIVYISCGPAALARDLKYLIENDYEVKELTPVDMFPRTMHVETVVALSLKK